MLLTSDTATFKKNFDNKLAKMLNKDELGSFILVLANSMQDPKLYTYLSPILQSTFDAIKNNPNLASSKDDLDILNTLRINGLSQYGAWETRNLSHWQITYNLFRTLRPERSSKEIFTDLHLPFNNDTFHFSKPFLRPEIISEESFENTDLQIMYQKFPFAPYHLLIVIQAKKNKAQFIDKATHQLIWNLSKHIEKNISDFGLAYNSVGAGASVNHLHIHGFINKAPLAIEQNNWKHNSGNEEYPLNVTRFNSAEASWEAIEKNHTLKQPYNLLYRKGFCYVIPRQAQGSISTPAWFTNMGWNEACGGLNLSSKNHDKNLTAPDIHTVLARYSS